MSEARLRLLEAGQEEHNRRLTDHDGKLKAVLDWKEAVEESTRVNQRMVEVGEAILDALDVVGKIAAWVVKVGAMFATLWAAFKGIVYLGRNV